MDSGASEERPVEPLDSGTSAGVSCPFCGESVSMQVDPSGGGTQDYVEDCPVCCNPWQVRVRFRGYGDAEVTVEPGN